MKKFDTSRIDAYIKKCGHKLTEAHFANSVISGTFAGGLSFVAYANENARDKTYVIWPGFVQTLPNDAEKALDKWSHQCRTIMAFKAFVK